MYKNVSNTDNGRSLNVSYKWTNNGVEIHGFLPPRLCAMEAAELLGLKTNDLTALKKAGLLYPIGQHPIRGRKTFGSCYYCAIELVGKLNDAEWWDKAQYAISLYNEEGRTAKKPKASKLG